MGVTTINIKSMCCQRCIEAVETTLGALGLKVKEVRLGTATFFESKDIAEDAISDALKKRGFEIIISEEIRLTEAIKIAVIELIHHSSEETQSVKALSAVLERKILKPFRLLNKVFVNNTQVTIQKYTIMQRLEKVKELIEEGNHNFSEIADLVGYKTPQHLSGQFKKNVGMSMLDYKISKAKQRKPIDKI